MEQFAIYVFLIPNQTNGLRFYLKLKLTQHFVHQFYSQLNPLNNQIKNIWKSYKVTSEAFMFELWKKFVLEKS